MKGYIEKLNYCIFFSHCLHSVSPLFHVSLSLSLSLSFSASRHPFITALPRLLTQPQVKNVTTSTIEIEWEGAYDGDGPVCGFIVELKPPSFTSWTSVGFVSFDEDKDDFEYTIDRLDAGALYGISVIILHCSDREGERSPQISQSTKDYGEVWVSFYKMFLSVYFQFASLFLCYRVSVQIIFCQV